MKLKSYIWIIFLALVLALASCHRLPADGRRLQCTVHKQQQRAEMLTGMLCNAIENQSFDSVWTYSQQDKSILFYVYKGNQLRFWSNSWLSASDRVIRTIYDEWHFVQWNNAQGLCYRKQMDDYTIVVAIPVKYKYFVTSDLLHNSFIRPFRGNEEWHLSTHKKEGSYPIYSHTGQFLFSLEHSSDEESLVLSDEDRIENFSYQSLLASTKEGESYRLSKLRRYYTAIAVLLGILLAVGVYSLIRARGFRRMKLVGKFQLVMTPFVLIVLFSTCLVSIAHSRRVFLDTQQDRLRKKADYVQLALQNMYFWDMGLSQRNTSSLNINLRDMSFIYETDIHIYDLNGRLIGTSTPQLFDRGLLPTHIAPEVFFSGKSSLVQYENIGSERYLSAYTEFINGNYAKIGYIALPSFISQEEMDANLQVYMAKILPLYIVLLLISLLVVWWISYKITSPLSMVSEQLRNYRLGERGKHIDYAYIDEVGDLVTQYNLMKDALAESTQRLARSEREMAWRTMARQVAHEINNPLTPMKLTLQHLQRTKGTERFDAAFDNSTRLLIDQIDNLSHIAKSFSSFAKMPEVNPTEVDVAVKLYDFIMLMRNNPTSVPIRYVGPEQGVRVIADADQITQVFTNIVRNALQAMEGRPDSDIIIILKGVPEKNRSHLGLADDASWIEISFSDNGPGIPEEMHDKIFVPNFTTKNTGAGLGLPISKNIVEGSGGKITFQTSEKGTTFFIYLRKK